MKKIYFILAIAISTAVLPVSAQQLNSAYFTEGYKFRHQLNPAFASSRSYFAIPLVGNLNFGTQSNLGISNFLYPYNGQLTTFMNGAVSADEFLGGLSKNNKMNVGVSVPFFSVGSWGRKGGFTVVEMNITTTAAFNLPYSLFDFMKNAGASQNYDISNLGVRARA